MVGEVGEVKGELIDNPFKVGVAIAELPIVRDFISGKGSSIIEIDKLSKEALSAAFAIVDTDENRKFSEAEFDMALKLLPADIRQEIENSKAKLFKDKDGISREELEQERVGAIAKLTEIDKSGDGRVDQSEALELEVPMEKVLDAAKQVQTPEVREFIAALTGLPKEEVAKIADSLEGRIKAGNVDRNDKISVAELKAVGLQLIKDIDFGQPAGELQNQNPEQRTK